ncbi:hypothetical protein V4S26_10250 [Serratia marcescens]|uniref:hypothetical protein n=1 Tax=Serratia marcescens TaxID=615 RepID=UPI0013D99C9E|nr:hypothetical protein [Serratia marcescens]HBK4606205.1 hypothetical protein [Serratia marcescens]HBK4673196.1 hypothetical protein [Serratia marcescens]HBL7018543.1 hypothetical protein [Serratia marcescens]HEJ7191690.1 hypothetical protein [Serratia marcescens]HEJ8125408.1 hypothetical protein [Serratia marcescens]
MPKSTIYLINSLLMILLLVALVWIGNTVVAWLQSKSYHGYEIYNCPKDISRNLEWFEAKEFCQIVERVDGKFFEVDEDDVKERAKRQAKTAEFMSHQNILGEKPRPHNTYYRTW